MLRIFVNGAPCSTNETSMSEQAELGSWDEPTHDKAERAAGRPRVLEPNRQQLTWRAVDIESLLPPEHRARSMWAVLARLDLGAFYDGIEAREGEPGRPAIDPRVLLALWIHAISDGVGSARRLDRLCRTHDAYRWICGGVSVNYHTLSDFRVAHGPALDALMTQVLAVMMHQGLVTLARTAQDGMRVRASAGAASFRRQPSLERCLDEARTQVDRLRAELEHPDGSAMARERAAADRAARERAPRIERALAELPEVQARKKAADRSEARVSTTDPQARVMKMAEGGFRPAYNVQFNTDVDSRVIVGVAVTNSGSDMGRMTPMLAQTEQRTGRLPREHLVDGGFVKLRDIDEAARHGIDVYAPVASSRTASVDPHLPKPTDTPAIAAWRTRMATDDARQLYKSRAAVAETVHADLRTWRGLDRLPVRGLGKVTCIALLAALTYNLLRWIAIAPPSA